MIAVGYMVVAMWFSFIGGAFVHHLVAPDKSYPDPVHVTRIGVDYESGVTRSTCDQSLFVAPEARP